ncbi:MAG TPA: ATP-binding protein [Nevskiaceae bacterium]|nr:ATP-binding protein [Nevskiaceae bacterium]
MSQSGENKPTALGADADVARNLLAAVVESSDDAIVTKTLDGIITSWNGGAERTLGYTAGEAIGRPITMLIPEDRLDEEVRILESIRAGRRVDHFETCRLAKGGRKLDVSVTVSPIRDGSGKIIGASKVLRDITDRKRREEMLASEREALLNAERAARMEAERFNASKDEFLATLSHELRTPLNNILGWTKILQSPKASLEDLSKALTVIERNVLQQTQLVDDLLDMSRIVSGQMRLDVQTIMPHSFVQAAIESVRPAAEARGVRVDIALDPSAGPVSGDPSRLQQVVWNLLSNALKFTPGGGRIHVTLERVNSHIEINVSDTGVGIDRELLPHVFERFRQGDSSITRRQGGLGLGLAIVKHIVDRHGGQVHAKSAGKGQGATFRVQMPVVAVQTVAPDRVHPRSPAASPMPPQADLSGLRVLAVDDEPDTHDLIQRVLQDCGASVTTASSGAEALKAAESAAFDVLVSDIGMAEMDGYEMLRQMRARKIRMPAIALTAFARSEDRTRAMLAGFIAHISKPVDLVEMTATVASVCGRTG